MKILINRTNIQLLNELFKNYNGYEIGGVLLGKAINEDIIITNIIYNIDKNKLKSDIYIRNISDLKHIMTDIIVKSNYDVDYIGEWHTHINLSTMYSNIDKKTMNELNEDFPELILLIKGKIDISTFLFTRETIKKLEIEIMEDV